jgi:CheY-like chemotaxis protein
VPLRLLLLEDNPGDAVIFREKIGESALDVSIAHARRLSEALDHLGGGAFDLVFVDLSLPDAQGLESVERVREAAPRLPLIVLTGLDDAATAAEAKKRGAMDYLVKWYVDGASLARYVRYAVEQHRLMGGGGPAAPGAEPVPAGPTPATEAAPAAAALAEVPDAPAGASPVVAAPVAAAPVGDAERALLPALEAALTVATQTALLAEHLAGSLRAALDLARSETGGASHRGPVDVLALTQQAADRARRRARHQGFPLRVQGERKKVMAASDAGALCDALDRLFALALATGTGDGVRVAVGAEGRRAAIRAAWALRRGTPLDEPDDPLIALDLALCRRLAARAGGTFTLTAGAEAAEAVVVLAAPGDG